MDYIHALEISLGKKAKIITSIAMFYDLEHPNEFVKDISQIIDEDGIWINQMNYLLGNKNIVDWGVFAEVEDSTDPELTQQIELVLPEHIQQQI